jgi:hypothetical protein
MEGSRTQPGDEGLGTVWLTELEGQFLVAEEKLDGANAGISFTEDGDLRLQSRGHFLTGGYRERHFDLFKTWANAHRKTLWELLGKRYVAFGEWLYAKHTIFYDQLPHYFLEFDVWDREDAVFLSTKRRRSFWAGTPVVSVPVLWSGDAPKHRRHFYALVDTSLYKSRRWKERLREAALEKSLDPERIGRETDPVDESEGLYIKAETDDHVVGRYKYVRASFLTAVVDSESHWLDRPIVPNRLAADVDIFAQGGSL